MIIVHSSILLIGHSQYAITGRVTQREREQVQIGPEVGLRPEPAGGVGSRAAFRSEQHLCTEDRNTASRADMRAAG